MVAMFAKTLVAALAALAAAGAALADRPPSSGACAAGTVVPTTDARSAYAAVAPRWIEVRRSPGGPAFRRFGPRNVNGVPTVLGILGKRVDRACRPTWYLVQLPIRPNGSTGWVRARDVVVGVVHTRILVDLSERSVTLYRSGRPVLRTHAAIGKSQTPTPVGRFYVNQRLLSGDPSGPYGPEALGVSAYSPVLKNWPQGGPVAIHGTNEPWLIGSAASNGCVRVANAAIVRLFRLTLAGTPVVIRR
jgi:lipoprotein-anchoring transpeptidase ErfK/SrfK